MAKYEVEVDTCGGIKDSGNVCGCGIIHDQEASFTKGDFYDTIVARVREEFGIGTNAYRV